MKIKDLLTKIKYKDFIGNEELEFKNISKDTRTLEEGDLYLGIQGETFDGNTFYDKAFENGASACILDNIKVTDEVKNYVLKNDKAIIIVENTIYALEEYAASIREKINVPVVAVTGSAGKTCTKDMIAALLSTKYKTFKSEENLNNEIGCPFMIMKYKDEEVMVLEMGTTSMGEIDRLSRMAKPTIGVITNIGTAHLEFFKERENILKEKTSLVNGMKDGVLVINNDNDLLHKFYLENKDKLKLVTYGIDNQSDFMATDIKLNESDCSFTCNKEKVHLGISGIHFIYNALASIAVASLLDVPLKNANEGFKNLKLSSNRMQIIKKNNYTIINDTYNANAEAMCHAIENLSRYKGRKIALIGSMLELGDYTKELHEKVAKSCLENKIDIVISLGNEMKYLYDYLEKNNHKDNYHFDSKEDAVDFLNKIKKEGDTILLKASHGTGLYKMIDRL